MTGTGPGAGSPPPLLVPEPVEPDGPLLMLRLPDRPAVVLGGADGPIRAFNPGWRAESLVTLFHPTWILVLRHENGDRAVWYLDRDGRLAPPPDRQPPADRARCAARMAEVAIWLRMAAGAPIRLPLPGFLHAFEQLPPAVRQELGGLIGEPVGTAPDGAVLEGEAADGPVAFEPMTAADGAAAGMSYRLGRSGAMVPLRDGPEPAVLLPGWRLDAVDTGLAPLLTLVLRHRDGGDAVWFADPHGRVVAHAVHELAPPMQQHLLRAAQPLLDALWRRHALGEDVAAALPDTAPALGPVPPAEVEALVPSWLDQEGRGGDTLIWALDDPMPRGQGFLVPTANGLRGLDPAAASRALFHPVRDEVDRLLRSGAMEWPSPFGGAAARGSGFALLLDRNGFAYRFRDEAAGCCFFVLCSGGYFRNFALYFPTAELLVVPGRPAWDGDLIRLPRTGEAILRHLLRFAPALAEGGRRPADPEVQLVYGECAIHIGHYVWQDLAGLAIMLRRPLPPHRLPRLQMFEAGRTEQFFGPEERIFPELDGRVVRREEPFGAHVAAFYRSNQRVVKYTAISVPALLRDKVQRAADATPAMRDTRDAADAARNRGAPVIVLGIRVGNRTLADLDDFMPALLRHLAAAFPGCTLVLDGLNDSRDRGAAVPVDGDLAHEFALARALRDAAAEAGVHFFDTINRSALRSVLWCARADAFIAPLGAALAKYRWLCNTPGMVLSSRWNIENRGDLRIYDAPAALEGSSEMLFNAVADTEDASPHHEPGRTDFRVRRDAVFAEFAALVRRHRRTG